MASKISNSFVQRKRIAHSGAARSKSGPSAGDASASTSRQADIANKDFAILKQFDLTLEFGPCIGITRMERWERAERHGLKPPIEVKELISNHSSDPVYTQCLWNDYSTLT